MVLCGPSCTSKARFCKGGSSPFSLAVNTGGRSVSRLPLLLHLEPCRRVQMLRPGKWTLEGHEEAMEVCMNRVLQLKNLSAPLWCCMTDTLKASLSAPWSQMPPPSSAGQRAGSAWSFLSHFLGMSVKARLLEVQAWPKGSRFQNTPLPPFPPS